MTDQSVLGLPAKRSDLIAGPESHDAGAHDEIMVWRYAVAVDLFDRCILIFEDVITRPPTCPAVLGIELFHKSFLPRALARGACSAKPPAKLVGVGAKQLPKEMERQRSSASARKLMVSL